MAVWCSYRARYDLYVLFIFPILPRANHDMTGSYPFQSHDPFVMQSCPHVFFAGNQPRFKTTVIEGEPPLKLNRLDTNTDTEMQDEASAQRVRLLSIPKFHETGEVVLVDSESLEVEVVKFGMFAGKEEKQ